MSENQEKPFSLAGQLGLITGGGTGSWEFEAAGPWTEVQCGSYVFMDADYQKNEPTPGAPVFRNALFIAASVMSTAISSSPATALPAWPTIMACALPC